MYFSSQKTQWRLCEETKFVKFGGFVFKKKFCGFRGFCVRHREAARRRRGFCERHREAARRRRGDIKTGGTISHRATPHHHKLLLRNCCFFSSYPLALAASLANCGKCFGAKRFLLPLTPYLRASEHRGFLLPLTHYLLPFILTSLP